MEGSKGRRYAPEFIQEAVRLAREGGKPRAQIAKDLGVSQESLRRWALFCDEDGQRRPHPPAVGPRGAAERAEVARLKRELRVVTEEREILKKACAFFAQAASRNQ